MITTFGCSSAGLVAAMMSERRRRRRQPAQGQIENPAGPDIAPLGVHHVADVKHLNRPAALPGQPDDGLQVLLLVHADLAGHHDSHEATPARWCGTSISPGNLDAGSRRLSVDSFTGCSQKVVPP
jgi:hypothetical protein